MIYSFGLSVLVLPSYQLRKSASIFKYSQSSGLHKKPRYSFHKYFDCLLSKPYDNYAIYHNYFLSLLYHHPWVKVKIYNFQTTSLSLTSINQIRCRRNFTRSTYTLLLASKHLIATVHQSSPNKTNPQLKRSIECKYWLPNRCKKTLYAWKSLWGASVMKC